MSLMIDHVGVKPTVTLESRDFEASSVNIDVHIEWLVHGQVPLSKLYQHLFLVQSISQYDIRAEESGANVIVLADNRRYHIGQID